MAGARHLSANHDEERRAGARHRSAHEDEEFRAAARSVAEWVADYRERVEELPVLARVAPGELSALLPRSAPERGGPLDDLLRDLDRLVLPGITHWNHPGFLAYFSSSSSAPGLLAEFVIAALGVNAMLWRTSPAATELELRMVDWLRRLVGLPDGFEGVILDTASMSSFTALLAAREAAGLEVRERGLAGRPDLPSLAVYVSEQAHSSLEKAAIAAGLGQRGVRKIPTDDGYRMDVEALRRRISADVEAGIRPIMVCATIGTTSTTSVDPVAGIADVCEAMDVWLHVDAAYAGPAAMLPEARRHFVGWERADSIVINPHKWMATPMDCSTLLFRDRGAFRSSLALTPEYLSSDTQGVVNLMDYGLPLGRRFRALKLWFLFRQLGAEALREMLRRHLRLASEFAGWIRADRRFKLAAPVPFGTVCFRANAPGTEPEPLKADPGTDPAATSAWNRELLARVNRRGPVFLSHTVLDDRYTLRLSVGSVHTGERHVRNAYALLCEEYDGLVREGWPARDR